MSRKKLTPEQWTALEKMADGTADYFDLQQDVNKALLNTCLGLVDTDYVTVINIDSVFIFSLRSDVRTLLKKRADKSK